MALSNNEIQVEWSSSTSVAVTAGGNQTSDAINFSAGCLAAGITIKADSAGPAAGDTVDFWLLLTAGDPDTDPTVTAEYPAGDDHGMYLGQIDTNAQDADKLSVEIPACFPYAKLYAKSNASSNSITVSACINEKVVS